MQLKILGLILIQKEQRELIQNIVVLMIKLIHSITILHLLNLVLEELPMMPHKKLEMEKSQGMKLLI